MAQPGDKVKLLTTKETVEGILLPSPQEGVTILKLDNGYNIGFKKEEIKEITFLKKPEIQVKTPLKITSGKTTKTEKLPTIVILHTGGTIASKVDYATGAVTAKFTAQDLLEMFPELSTIANVETELVANMMSEDIMFSDYQKMAQAVKKWADKKVKGIIIGHGTDTLGYTAAALSFMLEGLNLPVLLVGSQRSSDRGSTDANLNLLSASKFIVETDFAGVAVCLHHSSNDDRCAILPGTKVRKMHTSRRDAFKAVNAEPLALVDYHKNKIEFLQKDYPKQSENNKLVLKDKLEPKVGLLKVHPQMDSQLFQFFTENYQAFVIEGTGLGHAPTNLGADNLKNYEYLKKYLKNEGIVAVTSQCLFGRVHPHVYTNLRRLSEIGCIFCEDMLPETAFIKLAWLLGNYPREKVKELMTKNLRGEITESLKYEEGFLK